MFSKRGIFERGHDLEGKEFISIVNLHRKAGKLTMHNTIVEDTEKDMRIPAKTKAGQCILRYLRKIERHPDQERIFCQVITKNVAREFKKDGYPNVLYNYRKPIGENTIPKYFKEAARIAGIQNWKDFGGHGLRHLFITKLANADNVNLAESMASAGHSRFVFHFFSNCF